MLSFTIPGIPVNLNNDKNDAKGKFQILFNEYAGFTELVLIAEHSTKKGLFFLTTPFAVGTVDDEKK